MNDTPRRQLAIVGIILIVLGLRRPRHDRTSR